MGSEMCIRDSNTSSTSLLDITNNTIDSKVDQAIKEKQKDDHISKMIRNGSYESVLASQKRHAAWEAFSDNWAQGFKKNEDVGTTKKKRKMKR